MATRRPCDPASPASSWDAIVVQKTFESMLGRKLLDGPRPGLALHRLAQGGIFVEEADFLRELLNVLGREQEPRPAVLDVLRDSPDTARQDRKTTGLGFDVHQSGGLAPPRGAHETVGTLHVALNVRLMPEEVHALGHPQLPAKLLQTQTVRVISSPADDPEPHRIWQTFDRLDRDVVPLVVTQVGRHDHDEMLRGAEFLAHRGPHRRVGPESPGVDEIARI